MPETMTLFGVYFVASAGGYCATEQGTWERLGRSPLVLTSDERVARALAGDANAVLAGGERGRRAAGFLARARMGATVLAAARKRRAGAA
jgi:hypothetical protein